MLPVSVAYKFCEMVFSGGWVESWLRDEKANICWHPFFGRDLNKDLKLIKKSAAYPKKSYGLRKLFHNNFLFKVDRKLFFAVSRSQ